MIQQILLFHVIAPAIVLCAGIEALDVASADNLDPKF